MEVSSADQRVSWTQGKITIDHDGGFKWRAATWPKKEYALALSLENTGQGALILKIASLNGANDFLRQINVKVAEVLKNVALEEHISIKSRVGILPSGGGKCCGAFSSSSSSSSTFAKHSIFPILKSRISEDMH